MNTLIKRLSRRERIVVSGGLLFVICFLVYQLGIAAFFEKKGQLAYSIQKWKGDVLEMKLLQQEYRQMRIDQRDIQERLQSRSPDFNLFTFVEQQMNDVRVKDRVSAMNPSTSQWQEGLRQTEIKIQVERIVLGQLIDFLVRVESFDKVVFVQRMFVQKSRGENGLLDAQITILTFEKRPIQG